MNVQAMKKLYIKPEMATTELDTFTFMATSVVVDNSSKGDFEDFARRRERGTWGDLWGEDN